MAAASFTFGLGRDGLYPVKIVGSGDRSFVFIACSSPSLPDDRWLSVAETFEFLAAEASPMMWLRSKLDRTGPAV